MATGLVLPLLLGGCGKGPSSADPVTWWHDMEGGEIAQNRPPPPNPKAPYPKIANQPTRPAGMPDWEWSQLSAALAAQRSAAQAYAARNPIPTLPPPAPATPPRAAPKVVAAPVPAPAAAPTPAPAPPSASASAASGQSESSAAEIARLAAAPAPAGSQPQLPTAAIATATSNAKANPAAGNTGNSSLTFNGPTAQPGTAGTAGPKAVPIQPGEANPGGPTAGTHIQYFDPNNGLSIPGALGPVAQPDEANAPPVPATVPVPPGLPGFAIPTIPSTYAPPKPLPQPAPYVPPAPLPGVPPVPIRFAPNSAVLTPPMQKALLKLLQASQGADIGITGFGDAASDSIADQAAAMPLALERARAMTVRLMDDGVSVRRLRTEARALGSGGLARLVD